MKSNAPRLYGQEMNPVMFAMDTRDKQAPLPVVPLAVANDDEECSAPVELAEIQVRLFS
jgi:hypothetical protein